MKIVHVADLHFGKSIHGISLIDEKDQPYWTEQFIELMKEEKPQVILIAGDVYDRSDPSKEAVRLLDHMLTSLSEALPETAIMMVAGNHDSGDRLSFGSTLLKKQNVYIAGIPEKEICHETIEDEDGPVTFWLLPYTFPAAINQQLGTDFRSYDQAMRALLEVQDIDTSERNVLVAHQNVLAFGQEAERGGSETMVGGVGGIDYTAFDAFDYVALGHIHAAQAMGRQEVRYAGSPLCYHFSELKNAKKGPVIINLGRKGTSPEIETRQLPVLHPMREVRGTLQEIMDTEGGMEMRGEYIRVVLKDGRRQAETDSMLRALFEAHGSRVLDIGLEKEQTFGEARGASLQAVEEKSIEELFGDFFNDRTGEMPDAADAELLKFIAEQVRNSGSDQDRPDKDQMASIIDFASGQEVQS